MLFGTGAKRSYLFRCEMCGPLIHFSCFTNEFRRFSRTETEPLFRLKTPSETFSDSVGLGCFFIPNSQEEEAAAEEEETHHFTPGTPRPAPQDPTSNHRTLGGQLIDPLP